MQRTITSTNQSGFTIIELMIATVVSTILLLVITVGVVRFTKDYYMGINSSNTQTITQNAVDAVSRAIEFNATATVGTDGSQGYFCAGNQVFVYTMGKVISGTPSTTNAGLFQMNNPSANCGMPSSLASDGTQLLGTNMRITKLTLSQVGTTNVWNLSLRMVYGDPDLLCDPTISGAAKGSCASNATVYTVTDVVKNSASGAIRCKIQSGSQFCSAAELSTAIGQRIVN